MAEAKVSKNFSLYWIMASKILFIIISAWLVSSCCKDEGDVYVYDLSEVDEIPVFTTDYYGHPPVSGTEELFKFLYDLIIYPPDAKENGISGLVTWKFIIEKNGTTSNHELIRSLGYGCDEEVLRVFKETTWTPARIDGKKVRVYFTLPFKFVM